MTVDEFLAELYADELSDMFVANRNSKVESRAKVLPLINTGMLLAYAKYKIKLSYSTLMVTADEQNYTMLDTDVLAVLCVTNAYGRELESHEVQILGQQLFFPVPDDVELQVEYKSKPTKMVVAQDDTDVELELPEMLVLWLRAFVASRIFLSQKTEGAIAKGEHLLAQAELMDQAYQRTNTTNEFTPVSNTRLCTRGFA